MKSYRELAEQFIPLLTSVAPDNDSELDFRSVDMEARRKLSKDLENLEEIEELIALVLLAWSERRFAFSIMLHDMPVEVRLRVLDFLPFSWYGEILWYFYYIDKNRSLHDPKGYFSTTMTGRALGIYPNGSKKNCYVCEEPFKEEGEDIVWKECKVHLMHTKCFQGEVLKDRNPLWGHCSCVA